MKTLWMLMVLFWLASWGNIAQAAPNATNPNNGSAQVCAGPYSLTCASPPCAYPGYEGKDFAGASARYWINVNLVSGVLDMDLEGTTSGGVFGLIAKITSSVNGYPVTNPSKFRLINNGSAAVGMVVICGES